MDDTPPYRTDGGDRDERSSDEEYVHEPAVDHETWEAVTGGDIEEAPEDAASERGAEARGERDGPRDARRDPGEGRERAAPRRDDAAGPPTDRRADAAGGRQAGTRRGDRTDRRDGRHPDQRDGRQTAPGSERQAAPGRERQPATDRSRSDQSTRPPTERQGSPEWAGTAPAESDAPAEGDDPRSPDWDAARGREQASEESTTRVPAREVGSVGDAVATAVGAHAAVGVGVAAMVVILGIVSRPMFGRRDAIDPVYLVEGEVLIHALPALALALAAGTGLYVAGRRRAAGDLADAGLGGLVRAVVPPAALAAGGGSLVLAVLVVGSAALLLDPFLSFQPVNFAIATGVLAVVAAAVASLAGVGAALGIDQIPSRSSNSA